MSDGGRVYRRGRTWWVDFSARGRRYRESSGSTKKTVAKALLKKRLGEIGNGTHAPDAETVTFEDLAELIETDYRVQGNRSTNRMLAAMEHVRGYFGQDRALDITAARLAAYVSARQEEGAAASTIQKELAALKRAFNLAIRHGILPRRPAFPKIRIDNVREVCPTASDVAAIVSEITEPLKPVVRFAALTGWRKGEILGLRWRDVDFESETIRLEGGRSKNREARTFPFGTYPPLAELLREQRAHTDRVERERGRIVGHVFHRDGDAIRSMRTAWAGATDRAGVADYNFHDLRRHAVVKHGAGGGPAIGRDPTLGAQNRVSLPPIRDRRPRRHAGGSGEARGAPRVGAEGARRDPARSESRHNHGTIGGHRGVKGEGTERGAMRRIARNRAGYRKCRGWESNPHGAGAPSDFKSDASAIPPPRRRPSVAPGGPSRHGPAPR